MRAAPLVLASTLLVGILAGCIGDDSVKRGPADPDAALSDVPLTAYLHNLSALDPAIEVVDQVVQQLRIEMDDGVSLDTWVVRPDTDGPVPVVLQITPYYWGGSPVTTSATTGETTHRLGRLAEELVPRGYAYAIASVRGTGNSGGCFSQGGPDEAKDSAAVIEHLAAQSWSNGNVGLIGVSYPGTTPQDVWIEAPSSLKTIVPISGISDFYKYNFVNGVPISIQGLGFNAYYWWYVGIGGPLGADLPPATGHLYDPMHVPEAVTGEVCTDQIEVQEGGASSTLDGNKDAYWQARDFTAELRADWDRNDERASVFFIHGLQDWNVKPHMMEDWLPALTESGVPLKVWLGQWTHNWPQREDWWNATLVAWFDQFLKEVDTGILDAPPVQVQDDLGRWRHEETWPPTETSIRSLHLGDSGRLGGSPGSGTASYVDSQNGESFAVWTSEPLDENITISGLPRLIVNATSDGAKANMLVTLTERRADGSERPFNFAALSLNHAEDLAAGTTDITGERLPVDLAFFPQDDVVEAGSRIVLYIGAQLRGGPGPSLIPYSMESEVTLDLDGARLELPVDESRTYEAVQPCWEEECYIYPEERW